ncbi:hypothetical protein OS493_007373 [Desmophyllum pertusum]|uniref:Uncharacterized protein n=1 Tax=Desmophyllum pertusum TaxID=174260 RepID=A0A9W9Z6J7_9CNID|nr:hypothetical protein OS493_007373 [Desmophyllum pertusum]
MTQENEFTTLLNSTSTVESVYELIHSNVYEKKKAEHFAETSSPPAVQREESFDKIYSFAGWSLNSVKNTRTRALAAVEEELSFVDMLCHKNKKEIKNNSTFLRELDVAVGSEKGGLTFPAPEIQPFYHDLDGEVRELINVKNHKKYGKSLLRIAEDSLLSNLELSDSFDKCVKDLRRESSPETVKTVCKELILKYLHVREGEFKAAMEELALKDRGAVVNASQNLRDTLKTFSIREKRKR